MTHLRRALRAPAAIATLALGIGANTAIFTLVHATLLKPLPFHEPDRLFAVWDTYLPQYEHVGVSPAELTAWQRESALFESSAWYRSVAAPLNLVVPGASPEEIRATVIDSKLLGVLGVTPQIGHAFAANEPPTSVLLGDRLWRARFNADPNITGRAIQLSGQPYTVAGVLPATFRLPDFADVWLAPSPLMGDLLTNPVRHALGFIARLRGGVTAQQATARLQDIARQLAAERPRTSKGWGIRTGILADDLTEKQRPTLRLLTAAVGIVLIIACANVAGLLLSRSDARRREFAVRVAVGASVGRLIRQLVAESLTLSAIGGVLGLGVGRLALAIFAPEPMPLEAPVLLFLVGVTGLAAVLFGLAPAIEILRTDLSRSLKQSRVSSVLVAAEFAMAVVLLAGAGLLTKSLVRLMHVNPGFDPEGVLSLRLSVPPSRNGSTLYAQIEEQIRALPNSPAVAAISTLPIVADRATASRFHVPESPLSSLDTPPAAQFRLVSPNYLGTMRIPLLEGRDFDSRDLNQQVAIIGQTMARRFWPNQSAVGRRFQSGLYGTTPTYSTVIGVAGDVKEFGLDSEPTYEIYFAAVAPRYLVVRSSGDPSALASAVRGAIRRIDPELPVSDVQPMTTVIGASTESRRWTLNLLAAFAALSLVLALVGIYGVTSWTVAQRTREIGIRMAIGASPADVRWAVLRRGLETAAAGLAIGTAASLALHRVAASFLFEVSPSDPAIYAGACAALLVTALLACVVPARRASRVDPATAIRSL